MPPSIVEFRVDWSDCDPAGIVFYPQFFRMMNTGTHRLFDHAGLPFPAMMEQYGTAGTPLLDVHATFRSPARNGDQLTLESRITEWRNKTFLVGHVMRAAGQVVFEAEEVRAWVIYASDAPNGIRAAPIPNEIKAMFD